VHSHAQAYREHHRTELIGLSDSDPVALSAAQSLWGVEGDPDAVRLCRRLAPDIVSICTPNETHADVIEEVLSGASPRALFVEKPIALTVADAQRVVDLARRQHAVLAVNYSRRFSPAFNVLEEEIKSGHHGRPLFVHVLYSKGLLQNGSHAIDLMRYWLGEPEEATGGAAAPGLGDDRTFSADLCFPKDCTVRFDAFDDRIATVFEVDFLAERSRWLFRLGGQHWEFFEVRDSPFYADYRNYVPIDRARTDQRFSQPLARCLWHAVDNLVGSLEGREALRCTGEDGLAALYWAERIRKR